MPLPGFLKTQQSAVSTAKPTPLKALVDPRDMPPMLSRVPSDFGDFKFNHAVIAYDKGIDGRRREGAADRRRGVVAHMVKQTGNPYEAFAQEDMVVSLADLKKGRHPQLDEVTRTLNDHYASNVQRADAPALGNRAQAGSSRKALSSNKLQAPV